MSKILLFQPIKYCWTQVSCTEIMFPSAFLHEHGSDLNLLMKDADETFFLSDQSKSCHVSKKLKMVLKINSGVKGCSDVTFLLCFLCSMRAKTRYYNWPTHVSYRLGGHICRKNQVSWIFG